MTYKAPATIQRNEAVEECISGYANGADRKHDVWLKEGWRFTHGSPFEDDWTRQGFFDTAREFTTSEIIKVRS